MLSAVFKIKTLFQFNLCAAQLDSCCQFYLHTPAFGFKNRLKKKKTSCFRGITNKNSTGVSSHLLGDSLFAAVTQRCIGSQWTQWNQQRRLCCRPPLSLPACLLFVTLVLSKDVFSDKLLLFVELKLWWLDWTRSFIRESEWAARHKWVKKLVQII